MADKEERIVLTSDADYKDDFVPDYEAEDMNALNKKNKKNDEDENKPWWRVLLEYVMIAAIGAAIAVILVNFVIVNANIPSGSMRKTIEEGDKLIGLRVAYAMSDPQRGDIVIFNPPAAAGSKEMFIKRVIGLPGETVELRGKQVVITTADGEVIYLNEPYVTASEEDPFFERSENYQTVTLGEDEYYMMGDNRTNSKDSRYWGPTTRKSIVAKAWFRYWGGNFFSFKGFGTYQYQ